MAWHYHLSLTLLLLAGILAAAAAAVAADLPGGKKVTITMTYAATDPPASGKKIGISVRYVDGGSSDNQFHLDCDDDEPLGLAVQYLLMTLEKQRDHEQASRSDFRRGSRCSGDGKAVGELRLEIELLILLV
ncbi:unnamed protein product [Urochloa decumbens]|uniref:Uncharacterized protein n=1 Tax=Urochloa decumbens TaxID=240449 RepID=A0ABC8W223_9POAL